MKDNLDVLHSAFDIDTHMKTFSYYCEVIIHPDGKIEYAVPSHERKLIAIYAKKHNISMEEAMDICREKKTDYIDYLMHDTGCMFVYYAHLYNCTNMTKAQHKALSMLITRKAVADSCLNDIRTFKPYHSSWEMIEARKEL